MVITIFKMSKSSVYTLGEQFENIFSQKIGFAILNIGKTSSKTK